jgi:hypothetical protein
MRSLALPCLWLAVVAADAAEVYRYVDPKNGVEFSDTPRPGAERLVLPESKRTPAVSPARPAPGAAPSEAPAGATLAYAEVRITDPADQDTVRDNAGNLLVSVSTSPKLQTEFGHQLQLLLDGVAVETGNSTNFTLAGIDRGAHTLEARVLGAEGTPLASSPTVTFYLHRASKLFKKPLPRPAR